MDDYLIIWNKEAIKGAIEDIKLEFEKTTKEVKKFIGCTIEKKDNEILLHQLDLIKKLLKNFKEDIKNVEDFDTPAGTGFKIIRPQNDEMRLNKEMQKHYRSGV